MVNKKNKYRRGFKAESKRWANDLRQDMKVDINAPLCPWELSRHLCIPILKLSELEKSDATEYLLSEKGNVEFSATVCFLGLKAFIVINDAQSDLRLASNVAHEIAHVLLRHPPEELFNKNGERTLVKSYEDEAEWLGPELLVSEYAALRAYRLIDSGTIDISSLSQDWKITEDVIRMRMNLVGARRRCA